MWELSTDIGIGLSGEPMQSSPVSQPAEGRSLPDAGVGPWSSLVLLDGDHDMWLARVRFPEPPRAGLTFWFGDAQWALAETTAAGCRAVPAAM